MLLACDIATYGGIIVGRRARKARAVAVVFAAVACVAVACRPAAAAGWNNFNSVRPRCGQAGTAVEVTLSGDSSAVLEINADAGAPLGVKPLVVVAFTKNRGDQGRCGHGQIRVSSAIVSLSVAEAFVELAAEPESVRRGERKKFVWTLQHKTPFEGEAIVKLLGVPKGVSVIEPLPVITKESKEIAFEIEAHDDALLGSFDGMSCEVTVKSGGQEIHQRGGKAVLRIDPRL